MNFFQKIANTFQQQGRLAQLIIINVVLFLVVNLSHHILNLPLLPYLELKVGGHEFLYKFWTIFTYMFVHDNIWELVFNMLLLYFSSRIFFIIMGENKLFYVYVMSGLSGAALILILGLIFPSSFINSHLSGASNSVLGIIMVMAIYSPNFRVNLWGIFELAYKYFAMIIFVLSTLLDFRYNMGGKISHIGGAAFGLAYGYFLKKGVDLFNFQFMSKRKKSKLKVVSYNKTPDDVYNENRTNNELRMNELLDKISKSGYDSLTKKEKEELFNLSQKK